MTRVVADTGDFNSMEKYKPEDATTNPSLILQSVKNPACAEPILAAIKKVKEKYKDADEDKLVKEAYDHVAVAIGCEILKRVPGYVSTEIDARLSFDTNATVERGRKLIKLYEEAGIDKKRILLKIASSWEGIQAGKILEKEGCKCNMTLIFNFWQALACAQGNVTLISPFVGRILDWHKAAEKRDFKPKEEPGVLSVRKIYNYYKKYNYNTIIMGASFRNRGEIIELAGCDRLTISPQLLEELERVEMKLEPRLTAEESKGMDIPQEPELDEKKFRWMMNEDTMATEKLADGIRRFAKDTVECEKLIRDKLLKSD
jgi:transaldolase